MKLERMRIKRLRSLAARCAVLAFAVAVGAGTAAAQRGGAPQPPQPAQARAPIDLTGYWVSVITEDWRWRMLTPPKGDVASVPLNAEGLRTAQTWNLAKDIAEGNQCKPFGAGGIMRMPTRLHIAWQDPNTLKIETDAGTQTRLLRFGNPERPSAEKTWQGRSAAQWDFGTVVGRGAGPPEPGTRGSLKVTTTNMRAGYVRKNGVPYSEDAVITEYFERDSASSDGAQWFHVMTIVQDPKYFTEPFVTDSFFKKEPDGSKWHPTACEIAPPSVMAPQDAVRGGQNEGP
jgi:hypothetical protein